MQNLKPIHIVAISVAALIFFSVLGVLLYNKLSTSLPENGETQVTKINGKEYQLTFYDDFNGTALNKKLWSLCPEQKRQDVGGRWDDDMVKLDGNGNLIILSDVVDSTPVSGAIRTKGKFEQARGYFEIRCKLQQASGFWGAFWLMTNDVKNIGNGAKDGAEIDIFESFSVENGGINHAVHWDGYGENHKKKSISVYNKNLYDGEFHTFSLLWTENEYVFYIDGNETYRLDKTVPGFPGSCEKKCYLKITSEFGSWAGEYDKNELPDPIVVDYVKVYKEVK